MAMSRPFSPRCTPTSSSSRGCPGSGSLPWSRGNQGVLRRQRRKLRRVPGDVEELEITVTMSSGSERCGSGERGAERRWSCRQRWCSRLRRGKSSGSRSSASETGPRSSRSRRVGAMVRIGFESPNGGMHHAALSWPERDDSCAAGDRRVVATRTVRFGHARRVRRRGHGGHDARQRPVL